MQFDERGRRVNVVVAGVVPPGLASRLVRILVGHPAEVTRRSGDRRRIVGEREPTDVPTPTAVGAT